MFILGILLFAVTIFLFIMRKNLGVNRSSIFQIELILITVSVAILFSAFFTIVPTGHVGIPVIFSDVQPVYLDQGLNFINPIADVKKISIQTQEYTMSHVSDEGKYHGDDAVSALSKDNLMLTIEITVVYSLNKSDVWWLYQQVGMGYEDKIIRPSIRSSVRSVVSRFLASEAYSTKRDELSPLIQIKILEDISQSLGGKTPIMVSSVLLRDINPPEQIKKAIEEKLAAEQAAQKMVFVLQKEEQEAKRKSIEAQGIADFQKIVTSGISQPLLEWKGIEATEKLAASPNAKIIIIGNSKNGLPIILGGSKMKTIVKFAMKTLVFLFVLSI